MNAAMTTNEAKAVDVLAVLRDARLAAKAQGRMLDMVRADLAAAAVSELIEADHEYDEAAYAFNKNRARASVKVEVRYARAVARRADALARCVGAS